VLALTGAVCCCSIVKVFISWSKEPSRTVAADLRDWLPGVVDGIEPWMSSADIPAGEQWSGAVAEALVQARVGIVCITHRNQFEPWLLFEAGALTKPGGVGTIVCPYLIGMTAEDLEPGPLSPFQVTPADKAGTWRLVQTINAAKGADGISTGASRERFEGAWPALAERLAALPPSPRHTVLRRVPRRRTHPPGPGNPDYRLDPTRPSLDAAWFAATIEQLRPRLAASFGVDETFDEALLQQLLVALPQDHLIQVTKWSMSNIGNGPPREWLKALIPLCAVLFQAEDDERAR
jgi:hypothetical protein